jgi:hypothetical protein
MGAFTRIHAYLRRNALGVVAIFIALGGTAIALPGGSATQKAQADAWHNVRPNPSEPSDPCGGADPESGVFCGLITPEIDTVLWRNYVQGYEKARYYKDSSDTVHLQGLVQQITGGNASSIDELTIFRLPGAYRPAATVIVPVTCSDSSGTGDSHGRIDILKTGAVMWNSYDNCVPGYYLSLSGISFRAD